MSLNLLWKSNELRLMKVLPRWILPAISWVGSVRLIWGNANPYQKRSPISITMQAFEELLFIDMIYIGGFSMLCKLLSLPRTAHFPVYCWTLRFSGCCLNFCECPSFGGENSSHPLSLSVTQRDQSCVTGRQRRRRSLQEVCSAWMDKAEGQDK